MVLFGADWCCLAQLGAGCILFTCLNIKLSLIVVFETWLNDYSHSVDINGFTFINKHRPKRTRGGVGLYISDNLDFKIRADLSFDDIDVAESSFIEISRPHGKILSVVLFTGHLIRELVTLCQNTMIC